MSTASSSVSNGIATTTGPKISVRAISISFVTFENTVGRNEIAARRVRRCNRPADFGALLNTGPDHASCMCSYCFRFWIGPTSVCADSGSPSAQLLCARRNHADELVVDAALHEQARTRDAALARAGKNRGLGAECRRASRSASSNTMLADLPPSSSTHGMQRVRGSCCDPHARCRRADEHDLLHCADARWPPAPMVWPKPLKHVDHALRQPRLFGKHGHRHRAAAASARRASAARHCRSQWPARRSIRR